MGTFEQAAKKGPSGSGPVGFKVPQADTRTKGTPADEQSPKAVGTGADNGNGAATLGTLTEGDRQEHLHEYTPIRDEVLQDARPGDGELASAGPGAGGMTPESAQARDIAPDTERQERIPATERESESPAGLGKGVAMPPGSTGRESGQTP